MDDAVKGSPRVLAALTGEGTLDGPVDSGTLADTVVGLRRAVIRIARDIDRERTDEG